MTLRDAYWGTRIVASFTDEDIKTIVGTGLLSNPDAEAYLIKTLIERRDKIVSYWFSRMNPVDRFEIIKNTDSLIFRFSDLAVDAGVSNPDESSYMVNVTGSFDEESQEFILTKPLSINLKQFSASSDNGHNYKITIKTRWGNRAQWSKKVTIFIAYRDDSNSYEIASVKRDS